MKEFRLTWKEVTYYEGTVFAENETDAREAFNNHELEEETQLDSYITDVEVNSND